MRNTLLCAVITLVALCSIASANNVTSGEEVGAGEESEAGGGQTQCYVCNSHEEEDGEACNDPIDYSKIGDSKLLDCETGICFKYLQKVERGDWQINRGCAVAIEPLLQDKEEEEGCVLSTGTKEIQVEICNCKGSKCNGVSEVRSITSLIIVASLLCILAKLIH